MIKKILETTDESLINEIYEVQNEEGGATLNGAPKIGCKKINGVFVPLDQLPGYTSDKWRGTKSIHEIETDEDGVTKRLELTDDIVEKIEKAKAKNPNEHNEKEKKLAKVNLKDIKDKDTKANIKDKPQPLN